MKTLQNNFTTPEQSKRLLELGVPADSADCFYYKNTDLCSIRDFWQRQQDDFFDFFKCEYSPCWSVGRLFEIFLMCKKKYSAGLYFTSADDWDKDMIDHIVQLFEFAHLDFSKL